MGFFRRTFDRLRGRKITPTKQANSYAGAAGTRHADWKFASIRSADQEIRGDIRELKKRARELARNNDLSSRYLGLVEDNVVGSEGIKLQAQIMGPDGQPLEKVNRHIEDEWKRWSEPGNCSACGRLSFTDIQHLTIRGVPRDGEAIVRMLEGYDNRYRFALQVQDPDQLDETFNRPLGYRSNGGALPQITMGVEHNQWDRPLAYWLWSHHPSESNRSRRVRKRIPADQIIHLYRHHRANQTRGVSWFAPALFKLKMTHGYEEAEVTAARIASAKGGFFERSAEGVSRDPNAVGDQAPIQMEVEPGVFDTLPIGWKFTSWDPQHPTTAFKDFHRAMVRGIASGLGVSYTSLANDLEHVNFSSIRAGLLAERDAWRKAQVWYAVHMVNRTYRNWLRASLTSGRLRLPTRNPEDYYRVRWQARGWPWVDPLKDYKAAEAAVEMKLDSRTRLAAEQGRDYYEILDDLAREEKAAEARGISLSSEESGPMGGRLKPYTNGNGVAHVHGS